MAELRTGLGAGMVVERRGGSSVRYTGLALPRLAGKFREAAQEALETVVAMWRREMAPRHFTVRAYDLYGGREPNVYEERVGPRDGYNDWQAQIHGDRVRPLYRSGDLRNEILHGTMRTRTAGTGMGLKVTTVWPSVPRYTYQMGGRTRSKHRKADEITITTEAERDQMRTWFEKVVRKVIQRAEMAAA